MVHCTLHGNERKAEKNRKIFLRSCHRQLLIHLFRIYDERNHQFFAGTRYSEDFFRRLSWVFRSVACFDSFEFLLLRPNGPLMNSVLLIHIVYARLDRSLSSFSLRRSFHSGCCIVRLGFSRLRHPHIIPIEYLSILNCILTHFSLFALSLCVAFESIISISNVQLFGVESFAYSVLPCMTYERNVYNPLSG